MILAVPVTVVETAASTVLRARPGRRDVVLEREGEAFRAGLRGQGCPPRVAEAYSISFRRAVQARICTAGGGTHQ